MPAAKKEKELNLIGKLAKIMGAMEPFAKTGENKSMRFKFVEVNEILNDVRPRLAEAGIMLFPLDMEFEKIEFHPRGNGQSTHVFIRTTWLVTDGNEERRVVGLGEAIDTSDKAVNKAQTAAEKQVLQKLFLISNEEDNDQHNNIYERQTSTGLPIRESMTAPAPPTAKERAVEKLMAVEPSRDKWAALIWAQFPEMDGVGSDEISDEQWAKIADEVRKPEPTAAKLIGEDDA